MKVLTKICGLRDRRDVDAAVAAGADAVGFVFAESVRRVTPEQASEIAGDVPSTVRRVAVMLHPANEEWLKVLQQFEPDVLQTDADDFDELDVPMSVERWPVYREGGAAPAGPGPFVYEGPRSGEGETVDWSAAAELAASGEMILAGGLDHGNVAQAIGTIRPFGVDVSSGVESSPGNKDRGLIERFISAVRAAEREL